MRTLTEIYRRSLLRLNVPPAWLRREIFVLEHIKQNVNRIPG